VDRRWHLRRPDDGALARLLADQAGRAVTYLEVGDSLGELPAGHHHLRRVRQAPDVSFEGARASIHAWAGHRHAGVVLHPERPSLEEGVTLAFAVPVRPTPVWATASCRIVRVVDEPDRFGFAYGTLPHHPERGEESFVVHRDGAGVRFEVTAFSHPAALLVRLGGPIARRAQHRFAESYLTGFVEHARRHP
jgi:uncharacterized protein (UPF0548 family)